MPRPTMPPTPGSSTDIKAKDGPPFNPLQMSFELPPPAMSASESRPPSASAKSSSASSYHPTSPKSPVAAPALRRRPSTTLSGAKELFALPPPPTRSRKIIQMKPRCPPEDSLVGAASAPKPGAGKGATSTSQNKKKPPSATSVAGRKNARKTAHSLIERRRRSKMNEEFAVLKNMIPACAGEMHKLAILQASIDYVRYLEDCVVKLKAQNSNRNTPTPGQDHVSDDSFKPCRAYDSYLGEEEDASDADMAGSEDFSPDYSTATAADPSISPSLLPQDSYQRQECLSLAATSTVQRHYGHNDSSTSPAFGPQAYDYALNISSANSALASPALLPQRDHDLDQEATAALLMLNTDRRGTCSSANGRGISVRDLLTP